MFARHSKLLKSSFNKHKPHCLCNFQADCLWYEIVFAEKSLFRFNFDSLVSFDLSIRFCVWGTTKIHFPRTHAQAQAQAEALFCWDDVICFHLSETWNSKRRHSGCLARNLVKTSTYSSARHMKYYTMGLCYNVGREWERVWVSQGKPKNLFARMMTANPEILLVNVRSTIKSHRQFAFCVSINFEWGTK